MKYISMFSGIEAATVAWHPLGWKAVAFAEIEPFPAAVLAHRLGAGKPRHMPDPKEPGLKWKERQRRTAAIKALRHVPNTDWGAPNLGDMLQVDWSKYRGKVDLVVGGPPCQAFSVAGLRGSLEDARGNLSLAFARAIEEIAPRWACVENVPGLLNTPDNAFGCLLAGTETPFLGPDPRRPGRWPRAGIFQGPRYGGAWRVVDAQNVGGCEVHGPSAVPQRRERVFVVVRAGATGSSRAAQALFEPQGEGRDPAAERQAGANVTPYAGRGPRGGVSHALKAHGNLKLAPDHETYVVETATGRVTHALKAEGAEGLEDGTGRGIPIVYDMRGRGAGKVAPTLLTDHASRPSDFCPIVFEPRVARNGRGKPTKVAPPMKAQNGGTGKGDGAPVVVFQQNSRSEVRLQGGRGQRAGAVQAQPGAQQQDYIAFQAVGDRDNPSISVTKVAPAIAANPMSDRGAAMSDGYVVRRFTCRECERLQAFPDDWTLIPWPGSRKPRDLAAQVAYLVSSGYSEKVAKVLALCPDGPRYKAIGNSKAVSVVQWIGRRIQEVEQR